MRAYDHGREGGRMRGRATDSLQSTELYSGP